MQRDVAGLCTNAIEYDATMNLQSVSSETSDRLDAAATILQIYESLLCKQDRVSVLPLIKRQLHNYSQQTELEIKAVNISLPRVQSTATAQLGLWMEEDQRTCERS